MRKILISAAAVATLATASAPAAAQYRDRERWDDRRNDRGYGHGYGRADHRAVQQLLRDVERIETRIERSYQRRAISGREAQRLRYEAAQVRQRIYRAGRDGLSQREYHSLSERVQRLHYHLREERRDGDNRRW